MEFRHLRYFVAVAEELHFTRAAERLHIEQSPLSRAIRELESDLGIRLFERTRRGTLLTWPGQVFLDDVRRIFRLIDMAKTNVRAADSGMQGTLRIALSDGIVPQRLAALLAQCRNDEPGTDIRLFETSFTEQIAGLRYDVYDAGFACADTVGQDISAQPVWQDPLVLAIPARHPLLAQKQIRLQDALAYPLVACHPQHNEGLYRQVERMLLRADAKPIVAEYATSHDLMLALISAGYGIGLACEAQIRASQHVDVIIRPIVGPKLLLNTYLLRPKREPSSHLNRFIERLLPKNIDQEK